MLGAGDPGDSALETEAETGVRDATIATEIEIPLKGFLR
jgi:hypothetical protein